MAFDLLYFDGRDLIRAELTSRRHLRHASFKGLRERQDAEVYEL